jgi:hypothetical protein
MGDEAIKPLVTITGERTRYLTSGDSLEISAIGAAALCSPQSQTNTALRYLWSMTCTLGPCILSPRLSQITEDIKTQVLRARSRFNKAYQNTLKQVVCGHTHMVHSIVTQAHAHTNHISVCVSDLFVVLCRSSSYRRVLLHQAAPTCSKWKSLKPRYRTLKLTRI